MSVKNKTINIKWQLLLFDTILFLAVCLLFLLFGIKDIFTTRLLETVLSTVIIIFFRTVLKVYSQIWRYGEVESFLRIIIADSISAIIIFFVFLELPLNKVYALIKIFIVGVNLLFSIVARMVYRYAYQNKSEDSLRGKASRLLLTVFTGKRQKAFKDVVKRINVAIIGAGNTGVSLAKDLNNLKVSAYKPVCFIDNNNSKAKREINGIPVLPENDSIYDRLDQLKVQEIVVAIPNLSNEKRKKIFESYASFGYKIKVYDSVVMQSAEGKIYLRDFDIEDVLFRKQIVINDEKTTAYYKDKVVLVTGGGGSIGSELCRQLVKFAPKQIIVVDIYENGAYDVQQELKIIHKSKVQFFIEIVSITNKQGMARVFEKYHPEIVINAAAHKHVPLMENNCIEAVENNVFGTKNLVELCEEYNVKRFMMVSTDKAVNPTNVMGATKRMCEMIVLSASKYGKVKYSATRFGNVLDSAGSVVPLFRKQIANGGPITITDKRIIRYFMTIPEASQLVLESGSIANNGELMILDMGQPVKIYDLATSMIKLSGAQHVDIVETGLRPGEKLYEEILIKTENATKTENDLIFIEKENPLSKEEIDRKLEILKVACKTQNDDMVRDALKIVVPTFKSPEEVNEKAEQSGEMACTKDNDKNVG